MNTIWIVLPILMILMFDLGLSLSLEDFKKVIRHPKAIFVALTGQIIFLPLIAVGLGLIFKLEPVYFIGLVLIACCPGGSASNVFSKLAGGDVALSVILTAMSSIITLFTIPVIMNWTTTVLGESAGITLPVGNLIKQNLLLMLVPVIIGIVLHYACPSAAAKMDKVLSKLAFPLLMTLITIFFIQNHKTILSNIGTIGICVTTLILLALICSSLLSRLVRNNSVQRRTIIIEVGMQNAAQAISIACSPFIFKNETMAIPAILYSLMMNVVLLTYVFYIRKKHSIK